MAEPLRIGDQIEIPAPEILVRTSRSSGPGGQHANVTDSRVEVSFEIASSPSLPPWAKERLTEKLGLRAIATAQDGRSQLRNRELATQRLAQKLEEALVRPPQRRPTRPSKAAHERRLQRKRQTSDRKSTRRPPTIE